MSAVYPAVSQLTVLAISDKVPSIPAVTQLQVLSAYAPPEVRFARVSKDALLIAQSSGETNVTARVTQLAIMGAYGTGVPNTASTQAWTFVLDGHRFYVLPLGPEGDWAYDFITKEWCQLQSQGFPGLNFIHGVMWGLRVIGSDSLYTYPVSYTHLTLPTIYSV